MDESDEAAADAEAALDLIRMLGQPGRFTEALQALLDARPLVIGMVLGSLVSRRFFTILCPACGHPEEHEHDPAQFAYPPAPSRWGRRRPPGGRGRFR